jgi:hypothetical protein
MAVSGMRGFLTAAPAMETVGRVEMPVMKERELRYSPSIVESNAQDLRLAVAGHVAHGVAVIPAAALLIPIGDLGDQREELAGVPLHLRNKLAGDGSVVGSLILRLGLQHARGSRQSHLVAWYCTPSHYDCSQAPLTSHSTCPRLRPSRYHLNA